MALEVTCQWSLRESTYPGGLRGVTGRYTNVEAPYTIIKAGKGDRFAIASKSKTRLLLGYVSSNATELWSAERAGKKLRDVYASIHEAAKALVALASTTRGTH